MSRTTCLRSFEIASTALLLLALGAGNDAHSQLANVPFDTNGNGTLDSVVVDGDYDGDGHLEPEDIQAAIHDLNERLPGEEGRVVVLEGDYVEVCRGPGDPGGYCAGDPYLACDPANGSADCVAAGLSGSDAVCASINCQGWDTRTYAGTGLPRPGGGGLIDLDANDAGIFLACGPGVTIRGIPGKRRFDGVSPSTADSGLGEISARLLSVRSTRDVTIGGCDLEAGTPRGVGALDPVARDWPLVADGGSLSTLIDGAGGWRDGEWNRWWVLLRPSCVAPGAPHAWCSGPEEFVQVVDTQEVGGSLLVTGFEQAPASGDRYAILYHAGGRCSLNPERVCEDDSGCTPSAGVCDRSIDDDVKRGSRNTVYISTSEDVVLQNLRVSGSSHSGVYAKNSRRVDLLDSELFENGGYYGHTLNRFPSVYWFSGHPDAPCLDGDSDCRMQDARIERTEIRHGGRGVNVRNDTQGGQMTGIERLLVRDNHIHDLFSADGSDFRGIQCGGKDALCERNTIERVGTGIFVGSFSTVWPSQLPAEEGGRGSATNLTLRDNVILDVFTLRGGDPFGIVVLDFNEGVRMERNLVDQVGDSGDGIRIVGPNRNLRVDAIPIGAVGDASLSGRNYSGVIAEVGEWATWMRLEAEGEDLGVDPATHTGAVAGFLAETAIERLELHTGSRISLVDEVDSGNRGGIGGEAEALYVEELVFHDDSGVLNLNGLHLYVGSLDGDPSQIIDASILCPNEIVDPGEECDDGNVESGDGCWSSCLVEEALRIFGTPAGGSVEVRVDGIPISVATSAGESLASVLDALVTAIGSDPTLAAAGVGVLRDDNRIVTTGTLTQLTLDDPGLFQDLPDVPALDSRGLAALTALLAAAGMGFAMARRRSPGQRSRRTA